MDSKNQLDAMMALSGRDWQRAAQDLAAHLRRQKLRPLLWLIAYEAGAGLLFWIHPWVGAAAAVITCIVSAWRALRAREQRRCQLLRIATDCYGLYELPDDATEKQIRAAVRQRLETWKPQL